jgi:hypothetical protein
MSSFFVFDVEFTHEVHRFQVALRCGQWGWHCALERMSDMWLIASLGASLVSAKVTVQWGKSNADVFGNGVHKWQHKPMSVFKRKQLAMMI